MAQIDEYEALLRAAARERDEARAKRDDATRRLAQAAYGARLDGMPVREIARASGLTKQGLYDVTKTYGYDLRDATRNRRSPAVPETKR